VYKGIVRIRGGLGLFCVRWQTPVNADNLCRETFVQLDYDEIQTQQHTKRKAQRVSDVGYMWQLHIRAKSFTSSVQRGWTLTAAVPIICCIASAIQGNNCAHLHATGKVDILSTSSVHLLDMNMRWCCGEAPCLPEGAA
jgi:hypothetical protein